MKSIQMIVEDKIKQKYMMKGLLNLLCRLSIRTLYFNFKFLPFKQAIKVPILLSKKVYLREVSGNILLNCQASPGLIRIGFGNVGIFDDKISRTIWTVFGTVVFNGKTDIGHGSKISVGKNGVLILGENFKISAESTIVADTKIQFGNDCLLSWDILIMDTDLHPLKNDEGIICNPPKPIIFGNKVWIGCRCLIFKGTIIPNNCIIGANSLVNRPLMNENCLYAGNPVKCLKEKVTWEANNFT